MRYIVLFVALSLQLLYWHDTHNIKPNLAIMPVLPTKKEMAAMAFGDNQLYYRTLGLKLQMAGDTWGRSTPLKDYDYPQLYKWFTLLDSLDERAHYIPSLAAYYFSRSQHIPDVKYVLDYLEERSFKDPERNWWWLSQSIYLANSVLGDKERAIKIAHKLREVHTEIPMWARQMEAFLREDLGQKDQAKEIICDVAKNFKDIPEKEVDFMIYFLEQRLKVVKSKHKNKDISEICAE